VSLVESVFRLLEGVIAEYDKLGVIRERVGNQNEIVAPADNFLTKDGKWIVFVLTSDTLFHRFLKAMGREDLISDARFKSNIDRLKNRDALHAVIRKWFEARTVSEVHEIFEKKGLPYGLVYNAKDIYEDTQNRVRGNIIDVEDPEIGPVKMQAVVPKLSATPGKVVSSAPALGQNNQEIYGGLLGISGEEMHVLREEGII
jgi:formyl-CoA transferase